VPGISYKAVGFELEDLKARDDGWTFSGYASTFGNIDQGGDVVLHGAFRDSLERRPQPKLLWQHDVAEPVGRVLQLKEDDRGLHGHFKLSRTTRGHDAYQLLKDGAIDSMSIGYVPEDQEFDEAGIRRLKSVSLLEISIVSIPMNEEALITAVKSVSDPRSRVFAELQEHFRRLEAPTPTDMPVSALSQSRGPSITTLRLGLMRKRLERKHLLEPA
jgi:HK97 family phage prohead protease